MNVTADANGRMVRAGDKVEVLAIDRSLIETLEPEEKPPVQSMVGDVLMAEEVDEHGYATVEKWWPDGPDRLRSHTVASSPDEMELVESIE